MISKESLDSIKFEFWDMSGTEPGIKYKISGIESIFKKIVSISPDGSHFAYISRDFNNHK